MAIILGLISSKQGEKAYQDYQGNKIHVFNPQTMVCGIDEKTKAKGVCDGDSGIRLCPSRTKGKNVPVLVGLIS